MVPSRSGAADRSLALFVRRMGLALRCPLVLGAIRPLGASVEVPYMGIACPVRGRISTRSTTNIVPARSMAMSSAIAAGLLRKERRMCCIGV